MSRCAYAVEGEMAVARARACGLCVGEWRRRSLTRWRPTRYNVTLSSDACSAMCDGLMVAVALRHGCGSAAGIRSMSRHGDPDMDARSKRARRAAVREREGERLAGTPSADIHHACVTVCIGRSDERAF